jgi:hypothetical protein
MIITIGNKAEIAQYLKLIDDATCKTIRKIASVSGPREILRKFKFEKVGFHPIEAYPLNLIEQIDQTFTYLVALKAAEWLLDQHREAAGFYLATGAHAAQMFDIMSIEPNIVSAEAFAAVHPDNNDKLLKDINKLRNSAALFRYAFFYSPGFPIGRQKDLEKLTGVQVHCIDIH